MRANFSRIDEVAITLNADKFWDVVNNQYNGDYNKMMLDKYNYKVDPKYPLIKKRGGFDLERDKIKRKTTKINRFIDDFDVKFNNDDIARKYLTPDSDGYVTKSISGIGGGSTTSTGSTKTSTGSTTTSTGSTTTSTGSTTTSTGSTKTSTGSTTTSTGSTMPKVNLIDDIEYTISGADVVIKTEHYKDKYKLIVFVEGEKKEELLSLIVRNSRSALILLDDVADILFDIKNRISIDVDGSSVVCDYDRVDAKNIVYVARAYGGVLAKEIEIRIQDYKNYEEELKNALKGKVLQDTSSEPISDAKVKILKKKNAISRKLYRSIGKHIVKKFLGAEAKDYEAEVVFVLDNTNQGIKTIELTITGMDEDINIDSKELARKLNSKAIDSGIDDIGYEYCVLVIDDKTIIRDIIDVFSLNETFGFYCSAIINEACIQTDNINEEERIILEEVCESLLDLCETYEFEYNENKNAYECYFIFKDGINESLIAKDVTVERVDEKLLGYRVVELND